MKYYVVGGWVRDLIMGRASTDKDWVVVGASEEEMLALGFIRVGASFPVFLHPETREEYALARMEMKHGEGYCGFKVAFSREVSLEQDLLRRDLTINAIAYDPDSKIIIDPYEGIKDLHARCLRAVSSAFQDDPLRLVRLARFACIWPHFRIDELTLFYCESIVSSNELFFLTRERLVLEIRKAHVLAAEPIIFWTFLYQVGALDQLFPVIAQHFTTFRDLFKGFNIAPQNSYDVLIIYMAFIALASDWQSCRDFEQNKLLFSKKELKDMIMVKDAYQATMHLFGWRLDLFIKFIIKHRLIQDIHRLKSLYNILPYMPAFEIMDEMVELLRAQDHTFLATLDSHLRYQALVQLYISALERTYTNFFLPYKEFSDELN